jgi:ubiquinone/menaquinone biosynthesis C-methylase UbiE
LPSSDRENGVKRHWSDEYMKVASFGHLEYADCALCGSPDYSPLVVQHWFGEDFQVVRCQHCGMIRTNPRPTPEWKANFYNPALNSLAQTTGNDFIYAPQPDRLPSYRRLLQYIGKRAKPGQKLIDVGAASCVFTKMAQDAGFNATACDYSQEALAYGIKNYNVKTLRSPAESIDAPDASFDIVTIFHTIEHLSDPMIVLRELHRILKPGGFVFLETPNYAPHFLAQTKFKFILPFYRYMTKRQEGLPWVPFDHYYHWTPGHLIEALRESGFRDVKVHHIQGYRSNTKPNLLFWCAYNAFDALAELIYLSSLKRFDFRLVLLASGTK